MRLIRVTVRNIRTLKDVTFDLDERGLVSITGLNGAGKTTLFNAVRANLFNAMNDKSKFDDLVRNKKDAQIVVEFENNGKMYVSDLSRIKNKWVYTILEDGVDRTAHNQIDARKQPAYYLGISSEEWDASVHLSQKGSHILVSGKPSERKAYIAELFKIDDKYDVVLDRAKAELKRVQEEIKSVESFGNTKSALEEELRNTVIGDDSAAQSRVAEIEAEIKKLSAEDQADRDLIAQMKLWETHAPLAYPAGFEGVDAQACLKHFQDEKSLLDTQKTNHLRAVEYNQKIANTNKAYTEMKVYLEGRHLLDSQYPEDVNVYSNDRATLRAKKKSAQARVAIQAQVDILKAFEGIQTIDTTDMERAASEMRSELAVMTSRYNATMNGKCPTCGSEFQHDHIMSDYQKIVDLTNKIVELDTIVASHKTNNLEVSKLASLRKQLDMIPEFTANEQLRLDELEANVDQIADYQSKKKVFASMTMAEPMEVVAIPTEAEFTQNKVNVDFYNGMVLARMKCPATKPSELSSNQILDRSFKRDRAVDTLQIEKDELKTTISMVDERRRTFKRISDQINVINAKFATLGALHEEELFWESMVFAYGTKGLRVTQLQKVMDLILSVLPAYTSRMFNGQSFSFRSEVDAGNIYIYATRKDSEGTYENDISTLSGGEAARMAVCLTFAAAKARLSEKRSNMVVLDEVDGQVDKTGKFLFVNELLPMMREEYGSVFVISHSQETNQAAIFDESLLFVKPEDLHYTEIIQQ
jgi:DNA repair exonuclease SbcCD ATPase subunit